MARWNYRYHHAFMPAVVSVEAAERAGVNIISIHHGNVLHPYINYPFLTVDKLSTYVQQAHKKNIKVKVYYNTGSSHVTILYLPTLAGRSLCGEPPRASIKRNPSSFHMPYLPVRPHESCQQP